ncbi:MAG: hypothetical protein ACFFB7_02520 [Candidatus Sifarchaeia archaeon]
MQYHQVLTSFEVDHLEMQFPTIEVLSNSSDIRLAVEIGHDKPLEFDDEVTYTLEYDRKKFDLVLSYETAASSAVPDRINLVFQRDSPDRILAVSRANASIMDVTLTRDDVAPEAHDYSVNLAYGMNRFSVTVNQFQKLQTTIPHLTVLDMSVSGCQFEDLLAEILNRLRMIVVLDRPTSFSRTCWLSGSILDEPVLIVLDGVRGSLGDRVSVDVWSNLDRIDESILEILADTRVGDVRTDFGGLNVTWNIDGGQGGEALLTVMVSSKPDLEMRAESPIFFTLDYQGLLTESFETPFPKGQQQASIAADLSDIRASWSDKLTEPYLAVHVSDAKWKSIKRSYHVKFDWEQAVEHQTKLRLSTGSRFRSLDEFSASLNMAEDMESALRLFTEFCLSRELRGCESQRAAAHCARAAILTGLVVCFNPPRGLSDYLEMLTDTRAPSILEDLGTPRTWRDHISQIVQLSSDFVPQTAKLTTPNSNRKPGRPPTQLVPNTHPLELFTQFLNKPESLVCRYCRFLRADKMD